MMQHGVTTGKITMGYDKISYLEPLWLIYYNYNTHMDKYFTDSIGEVCELMRNFI